MNKIKFLAAFAALGLAFTSCNNEIDDTTGIGGGNNNGEKSVISLTIKNEGATTRATTGTEKASTEESGIKTEYGIKVVVFNENGSLDFSKKINLHSKTDFFLTDTFEITVGNKYFFVFANDKNNKISIPASGSNINMDEFFIQAVSVAKDINTDIANNNEFLLGSLWKDATFVGAGTKDTPYGVELTIGRLSSKTKLTKVSTKADKNNDVNGNFINPKYRIGSISKKINTVGVYEGAVLPTKSDGVLVTSIVHNSDTLTVGGDNNDTQTSDFYRYSDAWKEVKDSFYLTENTTALHKDTKVQYFGNTTYIQVETKYVPATGEVYNPETLAAEDLTGDGTFYTALLKSTGKRIILSGLPSDSSKINSDIDQTTILEYKQGLNYHKFVIFDPKENIADPVKRNRVLRNHYYEFEITNFKDLGSPTSEVKPGEPVPSTTSVDLKVTVKPWDKVTGNIEV